jgi:hypothetical protein
MALLPSPGPPGHGEQALYSLPVAAAQSRALRNFAYILPQVGERGQKPRVNEKSPNAIALTIR